MSTSTDGRHLTAELQHVSWPSTPAVIGVYPELLAAVAACEERPDKLAVVGGRQLKQLTVDISRHTAVFHNRGGKRVVSTESDDVPRIES